MSSALPFKMGNYSFKIDYNNHRYSFYIERVQIMIDEKFIANRIAVLRTSKNVSARDMSLSLGQSKNYINSIENKKCMPSMQMFLYICEYLEVTPMEFFDEGNQSPHTVDEAYRVIKRLNSEQQKTIIKLAKDLK